MSDHRIGCTCPLYDPYGGYDMFDAPFPHSPSCRLGQVDGQEALLPDPRTTTEVPF